jgi:hypothetical protein
MGYLLKIRSGRSIEEKAICYPSERGVEPIEVRVVEAATSWQHNEVEGKFSAVSP